MAISILKTLWGAAKGFFTEGGPDGALLGAGQSVIKQEETGVVTTTVKSAVKGENEQQVEQSVKQNAEKVNW